MKKINYIISITLFVVLPFGCNEETIDLNPIGDTEASFYLNETQMEQAIYGIYHKVSYFYVFKSDANNTLPGIWLLPSDDLTTPANRPLENFTGLTGSVSQLSLYYKYAYQLIARANTMLQKIEENSAIAYTKQPELKNYHIGESLFLRAWMYFGLWNTFGTAPLVTKRITEIDNGYPPNSKGTELLDQAIKDLEEAAKLLPASWSAAMKGRVTKNSALGLRSKCLVFRGTVNKSTADFTAAITDINAISGVSLTPNYNQNFDLKFENNTESLFEFQANNSQGNVNPYLYSDDFGTIGNISSYLGHFSKLPSWIGNDYYSATSSLRAAFEVGDPRLQYVLKADPKQLVNVVKYTRNGQEWGKGSFGKSFDNSINNIRILRYADVLLLKAEAIVRSGGNLKDAIVLVNQIRDRARKSVETGSPSAIPADLNVNETNATVILDWIFKERRVELSCEEGHRWYDLRRRHMIGEIDLKTFNFESMLPDFKFQDHNVNFPLPEGQIIDNPNLVQNQGY